MRRCGIDTPRVLIALVAAIVALAIPVTATAAPVDAEGVDKRYSGVKQNGRVLGSRRAPFTMRVFLDLKCPFCRMFDENILPSVIRHYVRTGKLRIVAYPQAFVGPEEGSDSRAAAAFALALGQQDKFWNFIDLFYRNQQDESLMYATDAYLLELASSIPGADGVKALAERSSPSVTNALAASKALFERPGPSGNSPSGVPHFDFGRTRTRLTYFPWNGNRSSFLRTLRQEMRRLR